MAVESNFLNLNSPIIDFSLKGIDGKVHSVSDYADKNILIIAFICNHCPYVKAVTGRLVDIQEKYKDRGVQVLAINSNDPDTYPEDSFENMKIFAEERNFNFPYLVDETQDTARAYDAQCTPDMYVYDKDRILKYRGRIDDNWKEEDKVTSREMEKAIDLLLENKEIDFKQIPSIGCSIKWKR
jgi:peroxiredoxin